MSETVAVILAAGKSKRMKSETPKVLHSVCGRPLIEYVLDAARAAGAKRLVVVVGHKADMVREALAHHDDVQFALQAEQLGTGHAVMAAREQLAEHDGNVLVLTGDTPLLRGESLAGLVEELKSHGAACVVGTAETENNAGLGRIVRDAGGTFLRIVEQRDASPEELAITEINTGCFAFSASHLFQALDQLRPENAQGEYYLTDSVEILRNAGEPVLAACRFEIAEAMGVNTQEQLAEVESVMHQRTSVRLPGYSQIDPLSRRAQSIPREGILMIEQNCGLSPRWDVRDLTTILGLIWDDLDVAAENPSHEWGLPTLASFGVEGVEVRTVVLREACRTSGRLTCFTDVRSPKVEQLKADRRAAWHFYSRSERVQVIAKGSAEVLTEGE
ncbi:Bifunctional protein GlmU [Includes: UDP-N-acetylglucosamine pyrophosphorylase (N-acetylglucosamine-1-phosphate uridyltransferase), partial [Durusdinium trenchii]